MLLYTNHNANDTYSVKDTIADRTKHFTMAELENFRMPVVGIFRNPQTYAIIDMHTVEAEEVSKPFDVLVYEPKYMPDSPENYWYNVGENNKTFIETKEIRDFADAARRWIPEYIFRVAASSTGKYHSACDLGYQGLVRHTIFVCQNLKNITSLESTRQLLNLSQIEIDLMMVACMFHDTLKEGWNNDIKKYHEHPLNSANAIRCMVGFLDQQKLEFIAHCIESHMGQWNTSKYSQVVLPKPTDKYQWLVHVSDYFGSRGNISMTFGNKVYFKDGEEVVCANKKIEKEALSADDTVILKNAIATRKKISDKKKEKFGIARSDEEIYNICENMLKYNKVSEKQSKYLELIKSVR